MKFDLDKLVRKNIRELVPYTSARDEYAYGDKIMLDANENPFDLQSENLNRYPDPYQKAVKKKLSLLKGIPTENIFLGNGSDEAIDLAFRIFCNPGEDSAIITPPTYGMYAVSAQINDVEVVSVPLSETGPPDTSDQGARPRIRPRGDARGRRCRHANLSRGFTQQSHRKFIYTLRYRKTDRFFSGDRYTG